MSKAPNRGSDTRIQEGIRLVETRRAASPLLSMFLSHYDSIWF